MVNKRPRKPRPSGRFSSATACISVSMVLVLVGIVVFFATMADGLSRTLRENFTVEVLLDDSTSATQVRQLQGFLQRQPYTRSVHYISKEKATHMQAEAQGIDPEEFLGYSPIPASFELFLHADYANSDSLSRFMPMVRKQQQVTDVVYPEDLMDNVNRNIGKASVWLLVVAVLLGVVSLALINNTMRMSVARRRHSIQTMKLVGARWGFIRRPFMRQAFWIGLVAVVLADALLYAGMAALLRWDEGVAALITPLVVGITLGTVALVGLSLTLITAFVSVNKHLYMSREEAHFY